MKRIIYIVGVALCAAYLLFSTSIVASVFVPENQKLETVDFETLRNSTTTTAYVGTPGMIYKGGLLDEVQTDVWAFCETNQDNSGKVIGYVFKGEKITYLHETQAQSEAGTYSTFKPMLNLYAPNIMASTEFSTLAMKNGTYELWIYVKENDASIGLFDTGRAYKKLGARFMAVPDEGFVDDVVKTPTDVEIRQAFDMLQLTGGSLCVRGWCFMADSEQAPENIYMEITTPSGQYYYKVAQYPRTEAMILLNRSDAHIGFEATVPLKKLAGKPTEVHLILEQGGNFYRQSESIPIA